MFRPYRPVTVVALFCLASCSSTPKNTENVYRGERAVIINEQAVAPSGVPASVKRAIAAANRINGLPYQFGGGHGRACYGLDCSGTVSHVLRNAGLINDCMPSKAFRD